MKFLRMTSIRSSTIVLVIAVALNLLQRVHCANFIFGGEAKRVCEAYKLICPAKKVCALQSIEWPRAMKFPVCVHETHVVVKSNICRKPPIPGKCKAQFTRWYFNVHMGACSWFTYSGCGGNQNKFRTAEECERRCMGTNNDNLEEMRLLSLDRRQDKMDNVTLFDNIFDVNEDDLEEDRELKLITAPAIAGEMIDLDKASLQLSSSAKNATATKKEERRRRKKEREERRRRKNKRREKNRKGQKNHSRQEEKLSTIQPTRESTLRELGPNFDDGISTTRSEAGFPTFAELRGRPLTVSRFGNYDRDDRLIWMMDTQFRRRGRRHRNRSKDHEAKPRVEARDPYSGAKEDTYYDKVKLFDILKNNDDEEKTNQV